MNHVEIYKILQPLIKRVSQVPTVILANQNAPAPIGTYCGVRIETSTKQYGQVIERSRVTDRQTIVTEYYRQLAVDCTLEFYREGALHHAKRLIEFNKLPTVNEVLQRHEMGINWVGEVHNLTTLFNANMEERASMSMTLWYSDPIEDEVNTIESVRVVVENEEERTIAEFDVDV